MRRFLDVVVTLGAAAALSFVTATPAGAAAPLNDASPTASAGSTAAPAAAPGVKPPAPTKAAAAKSASVDEESGDDEEDDAPAPREERAMVPIFKNPDAYAKELEERHKTRAMRRTEHAEALYASLHKYLKAPGLDEELKRHADRRARLRRIGNLALVLGYSPPKRNRIVFLMGAEAQRHAVAMREIIAKEKAKTPAASAP